jgi:hypothetical protein
MSVATNKLSLMTPCLKKLVPIMQHALVDYVRNPNEVDNLLAAFNAKGLAAAFWHTPTNLNGAAAKVMLSGHLVADTPGSASVGRFDLGVIHNLVTSLIPIFKSQGITSFNPSVRSSDLATNKFIDPNIGL